ncbi:HAD-IA family hydrolase [Candidatus Saccharibacteria bacterium]|jgi:pyrophosphatase PpaX|nr:HAD-IA family hydrolase [Candidatus Saccharibacteria bacterium]
MIKAVIFDIDGTLLDTSRFIDSSFRYTFSQHGLGEVSDEQLQSIKGQELLLCYQTLIKHSSYESLLETHRSFQLNNFELCSLFPDVREMFNEIQLKYMIAAATNRSKLTLIKSLEHANIDENFEYIITPEDVARPKPHPDMLLLAAKKLGITPEETVMVGDTINDIVSGKSAGMKTIAINRQLDELRSNNRSSNTQPDIVIDDLSSLVQAINNL